VASVQIDKLLHSVIQLKANDLHITTGQPPVIRHQGRMKKLDTKILDNEDTVALMKSITPDRCQQELQEKGGTDFAIEFVDGYRFRVAVFRQRGHIGMVMRRIPSGFLTFEQMGMPEAIKRLIVKPRGLLLVTGPTGSGKTTTLYSALNELNVIEEKIITTEDPVEYEIEGLVQCPINHEVGMTFAAALRSILRQDPDKILVGEIRDLETAQIAVQAALTGHIVFSTLHTNDAPSTITRMRDMGLQSYLINACVEGVLAQRLVRKICINCREEFQPGPDQLLELNLTPEMVAGKKFFYGKGCDTCNNTGYKGRMGIHELLVMTDELRDLISKEASTDELRDLCVKSGMKTLRWSGVNAIHQGLTTMEEIIRETVTEE